MQLSVVIEDNTDQFYADRVDDILYQAFLEIKRLGDPNTNILYVDNDGDVLN